MSDCVIIASLIRESLPGSLYRRPPAQRQALAYGSDRRIPPPKTPKPGLSLQEMELNGCRDQNGWIFRKDKGRVRCKSELGRILKSYYREAA